MPAFKAAVQEGGVGSVRAAYNRVNGTYCTEHEWLLTDVLKEDWGFDGYIVSHYSAVQGTVAPANAGLDFEGHVHNAQQSYFGPDLRAAVENGAVPVAREDSQNRPLVHRHPAPDTVWTT